MINWRGHMNWSPKKVWRYGSAEEDWISRNVMLTTVNFPKKTFECRKNAGYDNDHSQQQFSLKLSNVEFGQYSDGWPLENTRCCKLRDRTSKPTMGIILLFYLTEDLDIWRLFWTDRSKDLTGVRWMIETHLESF